MGYVSLVVSYILCYCVIPLFYVSAQQRCQLQHLHTCSRKGENPLFSWTHHHSIGDSLFCTTTFNPLCKYLSCLPTFSPLDNIPLLNITFNPFANGLCLYLATLKPLIYRCSSHHSPSIHSSLLAKPLQATQSSRVGVRSKSDQARGHCQVAPVTSLKANTFTAQKNRKVPLQPPSAMVLYAMTLCCIYLLVATGRFAFTLQHVPYNVRIPTSISR